MNSKKPNFLLVGAAKSGTTALANFLKQHPDIYISEVKEPRYFASDAIGKMNINDPLYDYIHQSSVLTMDDYYNLFKDTEQYKCRGEASIHYLYHYESAIPKIKNELGDIKIIIILRNPVIRALSNYYYLYKAEKCSFKKALQKEEERIEKGYNSFWFYKKLGFYYEQIKAYKDNFSKVDVLIYKDLKDNPNKLCKEIFGFLGVDINYSVKTNEQYNVTKIPKSKFSGFLLSFEKKAAGLKKIPMLLAGEKLREYKKTWIARPDYNIDKDLYNTLLGEYWEDIIKIENILDVDLTHWKKRQ